MANFPESRASQQAKEQKAEEAQDKKAAGGAPFIAGIASVNASQDSMLVNHLDGPRPTKIVHPYLGITSWHRVGPEPGMSLLMQSRLDTTEPEGFVYYVARKRTEPNDQRLKDYEADKDVYRPIEQGEQELNSRGLAQIYMSRRPLLEVRGGYVRSWWDQDRLEHGSKAVTHRMVLHKNESNAVGDEFRIGVVTRPGQSQDSTAGSESSQNKSYINTSFVKVNSAFAKELLYVINGGTTTPAVLVDHREGNVIDNTGKETTGRSGEKLRFSKTLYNSSGQKVELQVDVKGNINCKLPDDAKKGMTLDIPQGKFTATVEKETIWTLHDILKMEAQKDVLISSVKVSKLTGSEVRLGTINANEPVILGTTYRKGESQMVDTVGAMEKSSAAAYVTAISSLESFTAAVESSNSLPFIPGAVFANVLMGIVNLLNACFTAQNQAAIQKSTAYSSFKESYANYLSTIVKTA